MKRHHAGDLPPLPASARRQAEETDKMDKYDRGQYRWSRLFLFIVLLVTVSLLMRHCYDSGFAGGSGAVVRIETVPGASSASLSNTRKVNPIVRGESSFPDPSSSLPGAGDKKPLPGSSNRASSNPSASVSADTGDKKPFLGSGDKALPDPSASVVTGGRTSTEPSLSAADGAGRGAGGHSFARALASANDKSDPCGGRYIYVQELPPRFNTDMVLNCGTLFPWFDMCKHTANGGFGMQLGSDGVFQETGWYNSDQYILDIIFHNRIRRYECLTNDSSLAAAVFVPFYAGLDVARHLWGYNVSTRDAMALEMVDLVTARPEWRTMGGRDHFFVAGRTTWDFRRQADGDADWGNKLFRLPAVQNMTALVVEASPWHLNDAAVPFPTSFHPASDEALFLWQDRVRRLERPWLFSFAGAPRPGSAKSIRNELIDQCKASSACTLMACGNGPSKCYSPASYMKLFQSSTFCLQPQGDSYTRKSAFDAMVAGCIPVFFHPGTAYVQYTWHLPKNYTDYSVYISEDDVRKNVSVEERLRRIPPETVERMRDTVVGLIPAVIYTDPSSRLESTMKDAFDVTVEAVIDNAMKLRKRIVEGRREEQKLEMYSWKYPLLGEGQKAEDPHEWDPLFAFN